MIKKFFYDLETTGTDPRKHSIHQIAGLIEIDDVVVHEFNIKTRPHPKAKIEAEALAVGKVTEDEIMAYQPMNEAYMDLIGILSKYVDKYNKKDKMWMVGYNNRQFDDPFMRCWFEQNKDQFMGSWFWSDSLDVMALASEYLIDRRANMPSFKQSRVAMELGIQVDLDKLHDAAYDMKLMRQIYRIVTKREIEL